MNKDLTWNTWRSKFGKNKPSPVVDGHCDNKSIADYFASVVSSTSVPNSETRHAELFEKFKSRFSEYDHVDTCTNRINCELLDTCIAQLKNGKAPGHDGLTAEHITFAHPILFVSLSLLFNMLYLYGTVPDAFGVGIAIPLVKKMDGDRTRSDNYRCIHGRRRWYGRHGSCRTTFEGGTAKQSFAVPWHIIVLKMSDISVI